MLQVSTVMETALLQHEAGTNSFGLLEVVEVYANDYVPDPIVGYDPADAEKRWGGILGFTFLGLAYEREYVDRSDILKHLDKKENSCTLNLSNASRSLRDWVQQNEVEGMQGVIRVLSLTSTVLADSLPIFPGRLDKIGDFEDGTGSLTITQRFGQINQQFPPRTFSPNDPNGRAVNDILFEGFRFTRQQSTVLWTTRERRQGFGGLVGLTKKVTHSLQASSHSGLSADVAVPDAFGRVQLFATYLASLDIGNAINFSAALCEGVIDSFENIRQTNPQFSQISANPAKFYGYLGGEGPVGREQLPIRILNPAVPNHPGDAHYSRTAWFAGYVTGSTVDVDEAEAPDWMVLVKAKIIPVPNGSGVFDSEEWSDNPAYIARYILSNERYFNEGVDAIEDSVCYATGLHCAGHILDSTKGEWTFVPQADAELHGIDFSLYRSTGLVDARRVRMLELNDLAGDPFLTLAEIEPFDPTDPPDPFDPPVNPNLRATLLRVRYTCNVTLVERMSGLDFLYNVIAPTGRLFFRRNGKGRIEIHTEKPADNTRLRTASIVGATTVQVTDIDPWKAGLLLTQKLLVGNPLTTSEVRVVTAANYTADGNSITLAASGSGIVATASGANLTGGSASVAASGTVTLSGTPSGSVTVTINGLTCTYALDSFDTLDSAANLVAKYINAMPRLNQFIKATASGAVVTIIAKWGVLTLAAALANTHAAQAASPVTAPTLAAAAGGVLPAGTWYVGFAYRTAIGPTALSPVQSVVVTVDQKINVTGLGALPGGVASVDWYVSKYLGSTELVFWANNDGAAFSIGTTELPTSSNQLPPDLNESGEEILRVAMSFSSNDQGAVVLAQTGLTKGNIHAGSFRWPLSGRQSSTNLVTGRFFDATEDYAATPVEVHDYDHQLQIRKVNKKEYDLSGFDNYSQSSRFLNFQLSRNREGDWFNSLSAGPYGMLLEEGDISCASSDNGGLINVVTRAEEISIGPAPTFTTKVIGRKYSSRMFSDQVRQHNIQLPTVLRSLTPIPSEIEFIDTVAIRENDRGRSGFFVAVTFDATVQGSWRGWQLWADYGDGYVQVASGDVPALLGEATDTLPTVTDTTVLDAKVFTADLTTDVLTSTAHGLVANQTVTVRNAGGGLPAGLLATLKYYVRDVTANTFKLSLTAGGAAIDITSNGTGTQYVSRGITFTLKYAPDVAPFSTCTEADLVANPYRNLFLVGDEYLQAATIVDNGSRSFTISDLFHARFDSECASHSIGERVVYWDGSATFVETDPSRIGTEYDYKAVTVNQDVADAIAVPFTWDGESLRPAAPTDLLATRDDSGDWHVSAIGHPRDSERPESYIARIRRVSDGVTMRDIPVSPGVRMAAILRPVVHAAGGGTWVWAPATTVTNNNIYGLTADINWFYATQPVQLGTEINARVTAPPDGGHVKMSFGPSDYTDLTESTGVIIENVDSSTVQTRVYVHDWASSQTAFLDLPSVGGVVFVRIVWSGTELRFQFSGSPINLAATPNVILRDIPTPVADNHLRIGGLWGACKVENITVGGSPNPETIYSLAQQENDNVTGLSTIDVEMWQNSIIPGIQGISVREVF